MQSGQDKYIRNGTCCIFLAFEPLAGKRLICVKEHRTKVDSADFMRMLEDQYPVAENVILVQDNLNTHTAGSFYDALPPDNAFKLAKRFDRYIIILQRKEVGLIWLRYVFANSILTRLFKETPIRF
jgi:hypothetical protein